MKASDSSDAQKAFILKQGADGVPLAMTLLPKLPSRWRAGRVDVIQQANRRLLADRAWGALRCTAYVNPPSLAWHPQGSGTNVLGSEHHPSLDESGALRLRP